MKAEPRLGYGVLYCHHHHWGTPRHSRSLVCHDHLHRLLHHHHLHHHRQAVMDHHLFLILHFLQLHFQILYRALQRKRHADHHQASSSFVLQFQFTTLLCQTEISPKDSANFEVDVDDVVVLEDFVPTGCRLTNWSN